MNAPQIIYVICAIISTIATIVIMSSKDAKLKRVKLDIWDTLFGLAFASGLYYWGGFFDKCEWPQVIYWGIQLGFVVYVANYHGQYRNVNYSRSLFFTIVHTGLLYFGGFFK